jgi:N-acetylglucosamine malate deacetylase 2
MTSSTAPDRPTAPRAGELPDWRRPLVVVAHPDDESFGLGAILASFVEAGAAPSVLCFTHGEASTLHGRPGDLRVLRAQELADAARLLGVASVELLDEPDGGLAALDPDHLADVVRRTAQTLGCDGLLAFDLDGVTGHPDHHAATVAAVAAGTSLGIGVLGWTLPVDVSRSLVAETGAPFVGRTPEQIDLVVKVDRERQLRAVDAHPSQAIPGSVLWRRLELLGNVEHLRWLVVD